MSEFLDTLDAAFEAMQTAEPQYVVGAPLQMSLRVRMAQDYASQAAEEGLFCLAKHFSGDVAGTAYFARHAFQLARNSVGVLTYTPEDTATHKAWLKTQTTRRGL